MSEQESIRREVDKMLRAGSDNGPKEQTGNPRPANWPPPPQDKVDRITKGVPVPQTKPKS